MILSSDGLCALMCGSVGRLTDKAPYTYHYEMSSVDTLSKKGEKNLLRGMFQIDNSSDSDISICSDNIDMEELPNTEGESESEGVLGNRGNRDDLLGDSADGKCLKCMEHYWHQLDYCSLLKCVHVSYRYTNQYVFHLINGLLRFLWPIERSNGIKI